MCHKIEPQQKSWFISPFAPTFTVVKQPAVWAGIVIMNKDTNITNFSEVISNFQHTNTNPKAVIKVTYGFDLSSWGKDSCTLIIECPKLICDIC